MRLTGKVKIILLMLLAVVITGDIFGVFRLHAEEAAGYHLGPEDVISVEVWGHPDLQLREATVLPDGSIFVPLVGKVDVAGKTVEEVTRMLEADFSQLLVDPRVIVTVVKPKTIRVTVTGQVNRPGVYDLKPGSGVGEAIAMAGGPTQRAELGKVLVSSRETGEEIKVKVGRRYHFSNEPGSDLELADGDRVFVPETWVPDSEKVYRYLTILSLLIGFANL
ncbi:MAG: polysaccharide export protein [Firmicutes bacterium]|jgi:polysaccharide export outer membrane protein|nr:polysaccharide export protein [Bacillota bacterium]